MNIWLTSFLGFVFTLLIFMAIAGNSLVCLAVCIDRKLQKPENLFLISLAISDILVAILVMTFAALNDLFPDYDMGKYCNIWLSSDVMCCTASICNLCAISFDRYWHIRHPLRYCLKMTRTRIIAIIVVIWVISVSISFLPIHLNLSGIGLNRTLDTSQCGVDFSLPYALISSSISFFIPCTVMIFLYSKLYWTARSHSELLQSQFRCLESAILLGTAAGGMSIFRKKTIEGGSTPSDLPKVHTRSVHNDKAKKTIGCIMGVFLACWLPFFVINILKSACQCIPVYVFQTVTWIGYANSMANPIIYSIFSKDFRKAFRKILSCKKRTMPGGCSHSNTVSRCNSVQCTMYNSIVRVKEPIVPSPSPVSAL